MRSHYVCYSGAPQQRRLGLHLALLLLDQAVLLAEFRRLVQHVRVLRDLSLLHFLVNLGQHRRKCGFFAGLVLLYSLVRPENVLQEPLNSSVVHVGDILYLRSQTLHAHGHGLIGKLQPFRVFYVNFVRIWSFPEQH
jgi:hypothetical protein